MMPTLATPGVISPGQLGPRRRAPFSRMNGMTFAMSRTGMPSVMQTMKAMPASAASAIAPAAIAGGT